MAPHILLIGAHGKVSQHLVPLLLSRSYHLTALIRSPDQESTIRNLAPAQSKSHLDVLVHSLQDVKNPSDASKILQKTRAEIVIWSAGAGGKGGDAATRAIDHIAASAFVDASTSEYSSVRRFLMVSYLGSRREKPSWWSDEAWSGAQKVNNEVLPAYAAAKVAVDERLTGVSGKGKDFGAVCLRPGTLSDGAAGKVALGKTGGKGQVSREVVARVAAELVDRWESWKVGKCVWLDLLDGEEEVKGEVERCLRDKVDCVEGEDVERMKKEAGVE